MTPERLWWRRVPLVLVRPREVFAALGADDQEDLDARQEPLTLIALLAGMSAVSLSPAWRTLLDQPTVDWLVVAVFTFIGGVLYGAFGYILLGGALYVGVRGMGSAAPYRLARQVLGFSAVPLACAFLVLTPVALAVFGGDWYREGGADEGAGGALLLALGIGTAVWSLGLVVLGLRVVYGFTWGRAAGTLGLVALTLAALVALPSAL